MNTRTPLIVGLLACAFSCALALPSDITIADFEAADFGNWKVEGTAFGTGPAQGSVDGQMTVTGFFGKGFANSFHGRDDATGRLISPEFKIERDSITFLIGGGGFPGETCINLVVDGKVARTSTGTNIKPGGNESLLPDGWDVRDLRGKTAHIEIVDQRKGGWGHINVDHIVMTDVRFVPNVVNATREFTAEKRYLNFPIKVGAPRRQVSLIVDGKAEPSIDMEIAPGEPDWWAFRDITPLRGKTVGVQVNRISADSAGWKAIQQSDEPLGMENLYHEKLRPQFHFSTRRGWLNDPNGLVYYKGQWHLFYQHNPYVKYNACGVSMHWGHAISTDLVHWKELSDALYPDEKGQCWTGACFVDWKNQLGLKEGKEDVIVAFYLRTNIGLSYAYSTDAGMTWKDYPGNPLVKPRYGRVDSPKPLWHEPTQRWIAPTYDHEKFGDKVAETVTIYSSADLKSWQRESNIGPVGINAECPEMFELPVNGDPQNKKWVMVCGDGRYFVGNFDGKNLTNLAGETVGTKDYIRGITGRYYATMTWSDVPKEDGRRIQITWMARGDYYLQGMPFDQQMTFPVTLSLHTTEEGIRMFWQPVREIEKLYAKKNILPAQSLAPGQNLIPNVSGELFDINAEFEPGSAEEVGFLVRNVPVVYNTRRQTLSCGPLSLPLKLMDGKVRMRILLDRSSIEVFGNEGRVYLPLVANFEKEFPGDNPLICMVAKGGKAKLLSGEIYELNSIWK